MAFAWIPGGWDANRDGVMEGVQHNTYDVEFYGPNPLCGIYYLGALRAAEEMARAVGDNGAAAEYRGLFERGSKWIDAEPVQRRILHPEGARHSQEPDRVRSPWAIWAPTTRKSRNSRWATAAWPIN